MRNRGCHLACEPQRSGFFRLCFNYLISLLSQMGSGGPKSYLCLRTAKLSFAAQQTDFGHLEFVVNQVHLLYTCKR